LFKEVPLNPGVYIDDTPAKAQGFFINLDKVRFVRGLPQVFGGWELLCSTALNGKCRNLHAWLDHSLIKWLAAGTHSNAYILSDGLPYDVTPVATYTQAVSISFTTVLGSASVVADWTSHGLVVGKVQPSGQRHRRHDRGCHDQFRRRDGDEPKSQVRRHRGQYGQPSYLHRRANRNRERGAYCGNVNVKIPRPRSFGWDRSPWIWHRALFHEFILQLARKWRHLAAHLVLGELRPEPDRLSPQWEDLRAGAHHQQHRIGDQRLVHGIRFWVDGWGELGLRGERSHGDAFQPRSLQALTLNANAFYLVRICPIRIRGWDSRGDARRTTVGTFTALAANATYRGTAFASASCNARIHRNGISPERSTAFLSSSSPRLKSFPTLRRKTPSSS
jgi:hypothetical protein